MSAPGRPWITANQVTLARLIPMPLLSWLIYQGGKSGFAHNPYMWTALVAGTVIASTDWVDGMLARKYGPTVLGGLLDPIADKVFVAFAYMPFADPTLTPDGSLVPAWACGAMFVREFFVTALRSAYEQRDLTLKTSYLAKVKTWSQMQGIGVMLLFPLVANDTFVFWLLVIGAVLPMIAMFGLYIKRKTWWRGAFVMTGCFLAILSLQLWNKAYTIPGIMIGIVILTWASAFDYLAVGWKQLRGRGDFARADFVRLLGSITIPTLVFSVLVRAQAAPRWPLFMIMALELAAGGLDNLLSHHKAATKALAWGGRVIGVSIMLGGAMLAPDRADLFTIIAAAGSLGGVAAEFWRGRHYFMDKRIRDKARRDAAAAAAASASLPAEAPAKSADPG